MNSGYPMSIQEVDKRKRFWLRSVPSLVLACCAAAAAPIARSAEIEPFPVVMHVDAAKKLGPFKPIWRFFGADEPNYAYMRYGRKLIATLGGFRPNDVYFRAHNLLNTGDGTPGLKWGSTGVYQEGVDGKAQYDWTILDRIFDCYREHGVRPYVEIGFMPEALSPHPEPYQHHWTPTARYEDIYTGWSYPPKDFEKWADLVYRWTLHCLDRYGSSEVERWYWEVWNEPNIGYWRGTREEFFKLHDYAIAAVRRALPKAKVGGPDSAGSGGDFSRAFFEHCLRGTNYATGKVGTPLDFVSFHAKGSPVYTNGHVRMGIAQHLRTIQSGFRLIAAYPELRNTPVVIGESDPEGCAACQGAALAYRNGTMYSSYTAASFARKYELAERQGVPLDGVLTWAFEFEDQPYFAGFRSLASNGIEKPVLNVFRFFSHLGGERVAVDSDYGLSLDKIVAEGVRGQPDVMALAAASAHRLGILAWHYHDDDLPGPPAQLELRVEGLPPTLDGAQLLEHRIDEGHGNAYAAWLKMGAPQSLTSDQYAQLEQAVRSTQVAPERNVSVQRGQASITLPLPRQAVSLVELSW